jgi:glycosyltransferase involved in cell wall biosynthesis
MDAANNRNDDLVRAKAGSVLGDLPRISVVVPSYNQGHFLPDTLESIFRQDYPDLEVVVIDGGSTDCSVDIIRSYAPRLKHWQSERDGGQSAAINAGVSHCTGDLVTWLNSDDFYWRDSLWVVGRAWAAHPGRGLYIGNGLRHDQRTGKSIPFLPRHMALNRAALREGPDYLLQPSTFFLRQAWESVGGLDNNLRFCMDWDIFLRIVQCYPVVLINEFLGVSREYEETKTRSGKMTRSIEIIRMIQRHTQTEVTIGSVGYLLETLLSTMQGQQAEKIREHINWSLVWTFKSFSQSFGEGCWSPCHAEPQDDMYLPFAGQAQPSRPVEGPPLPSFSVVIPARDERAALEQTLESVLHQDYSPLEVLVLDLESADGSDELLRRYAGRITALRCPGSLTTVQAVNRGLAAAQGEVLTWLQPGDLLAVGALRAAGEAFRGDPEREMVYGNAVFVDPQDRLTLVDMPPCRTGFWIGEHQTPQGVPVYADDVYQVPQPTLCFRRGVLDKFGPLNESYKHIFDYEFVIRLVRQARVHKLERTQALIRIGARETPHRWNAILAELYQYSRPHWPGLLSRQFPTLLVRFLTGYMRRKFRGRPRDPYSLMACLMTALSVVTRLGNPERWWKERFFTPSWGAPPLHLPLPAVRVWPSLPLVGQEGPPLRDGTLFRTAVSMPRLPLYPGRFGREARFATVLSSLARFSTVEFFSQHELPDGLPATMQTPPVDTLHTPRSLQKERPDLLRPAFLKRRLHGRISAELRRHYWPIPGPRNPFSVSKQFHIVRAHATVAIQHVLDRKSAPDFLFVGDQTNPLAFTLVTEHRPTRLILISCGVEAERVEREAQNRRGLARLGMKMDARRARYYERANLAHYDGLIVLRETDRQRYVTEYSFPGERIFTAGRGVDLDYWRELPRRRESPPAVVFVADLKVPDNWRAAHTLLHEILPRVRQRLPETRCWIVNPGSPVGLPVREDARTEVHHEVVDVRPYLARAALACLPLTNADDGSILETMAAQVPVVCTPSTIEGLALDADEECLCAADIATLAAAVEELLRDPARAERMAAAAHEQFSRCHAPQNDYEELQRWLEQLALLPRRNGVSTPTANAALSSNGEDTASKAA